MRILSSQIEALARKSEQEFVERMSRYLRDSYPNETELLSDAGLDAWVGRNTERAMGHGIDTEPEVAQYLLLCLRLGEDAPERLPWFREPLRNEALVAEGKIRVLVREAHAAAVTDLDRFVMESFAA